MDRAYLIPLAGLPNLVCYLRLGPTANNQAKGIRFAADYEIGRESPPASPRLALLTSPNPKDPVGAHQ